MKKILAIAVILFAPTVFAYPNNNPNCFGSETNYTCRDNSTGNTYNVSKYGNTTSVQANNYRTGESWSQNTQNYGNQSYTNGRDKDGNTWRHSTNQIGNTQFYNGSDSNGNTYNGSCNPYTGCYTNR